MNSQVSTSQEGTEKKWWQSSNFWTDIIMILAVIFVGFPEQAGISGVAAVFGILAAFKAIRQYFNTGPKPDFKKAIKDSNFWNYIATAAVAIIPGIPVELFDHAESIAVNIIDGNWQGVLVALFSIGTILFNLFKKSSQTDPDTVAST